MVYLHEQELVFRQQVLGPQNEELVSLVQVDALVHVEVLDVLEVLRGLALGDLVIRDPVLGDLVLGDLVLDDLILDDLVLDGLVLDDLVLDDLLLHATLHRDEDLDPVGYQCFSKHRRHDHFSMEEVHALPCDNRLVVAFQFPNDCRARIVALSNQDLQQ